LHVRSFVEAAASEGGTKRAPNKLSGEVFGRWDSPANNMSSKINRIHDSRGAPLTDQPMSGGSETESPEAAAVERTGGYRATIEEGLRLNRAFINIKNPVVRAAIVNLVFEAVKYEGGEGLSLPIRWRPKAGPPRPG
jgi:hypothetical protein